MSLIDALNLYPPLSFEYLLKNIQYFPSSPTAHKLAFLEKVIKAHAFYNHDVNFLSRVYRVRNAEGYAFNHIQDVLWPQSPSSNNRFGDLLYTADSSQVAFAEKSDAISETFVLASFTMQTDSSCKMLPVGELYSILKRSHGLTVREGAILTKILRDIRELENKDYERFICFCLQESFIVEQLTSQERLLSQAAGEKILNRFNGSINIIGYPSVKIVGFNYGYNVGIIQSTFWNNWDIFSISKVHVRCLPYGFYDYFPIEHVTAIAPDGTLIWEPHTSDGHLEISLSPTNP